MRQILHVILLTCFSGFFSSGSAQMTLSRQVIAVTGSFSGTPSFSLSSTLGEPVSSTVRGGNVILTQGFQQPSVYEPMLDLHTYNAFSPDGDGINDYWIIDGIEQHKGNVVRIYNRWGILLWEGTNYDNVNVVWDGYTNTGVEMPSATYFYLIKVGDRKKISGWVQLLN